MRLFVSACLFLLATACNSQGSYQRGYVISKVQETAIETEAVTEPLED